MPSNRGAEPSELRHVLETPSVMPYEPSAPCAGCARALDPLRAPAVSATDERVRYFCSQACHESFTESERVHRRRVAAEREAPTPPRTTTRPREFEAVSLRAPPTAVSTPRWPLVSALACLALALSPVPGAERLAALGLMVVAALFASQATGVRTQVGLLAWLSAPLAVSLLGLASLLGAGLWALVAAALGVGSSFLRELLLERVRNQMEARRLELHARFPARAVRLSAGVAGERAREECATASLRCGETLLAEAPSVLPVDARVTAGSARVLPYPSAPESVVRGVGDGVLAGALLVEGTLELCVLRVGDARVLVRALADEPPRAAVGFLQRAGVEARRSDRVLLALGVLLAIAVARSRHAAAVLEAVGAALLALPLLSLPRAASTPLHLARRWAAALGVSFRDREAIACAGRVDCAVLRAEGTVVERDHVLLEIVPVGETLARDELLTLALSAEQAAPSHALARALAQHAEKQGVRPISLRRLSHSKGASVSALSDGRGALVVGSRQALLALGISVAVADAEAERAERDGHKVVFLALGEHVRGLLVFSQALRSEARAAVQRLLELGLDVELVSGDHRATVEGLARTLGIQQGKGELGREQRAQEVRRLREREARVVAIARAAGDQAMVDAADLGLVIDSMACAEPLALGTATRDLRSAVEALAVARAARRMEQLGLGVSGASLVLSVLAAAAVVSAPLVLACAALLDASWLAGESAALRSDHSALLRAAPRAKSK